jgi:hypothetical protein
MKKNPQRITVDPPTTFANAPAGSDAPMPDVAFAKSGEGFFPSRKSKSNSTSAFSLRLGFAGLP